jgi:phosphate transport system substrate-binding protein
MTPAAMTDAENFERSRAGLNPERHTVKLKNVATVGAIALVAALALSSCSSTSTDSGSKPATTAKLSGTITTGGSSAQANAQQAWTTAFQAQQSGVTINYDKSQGSGGGITNWLAGTYDFAGSDAALTADQETSAASVCGSGTGLNIPVYLSGVAIIFNLKGVTKWNDPAIVKANPGVTLPSDKITPVVRADGSGTTANFTTYLSQVAPSIWKFPVSTAWPVTGESAQQGGSGIVSTVAAGNDTIGYADQSSIGSATAASVQLGTTTTYVAYSAAGATQSFKESATSKPAGAGDLTQDLDYTKISGTNSYPIPLLSYDVLCSQFKSAKQAALVKGYLSFITSATGQAVAAKNAGSAPLPANILTEAATSLKSVK